MVRAQLFAGAVFVFLAANVCTAARFADEASAVVVGEVLSGLQTGKSALFTLSVIRTLKGDLSPGTSITVNAVLSRPTNRNLTGHYGMWFLRRTGQQWLLIPTMPKVGFWDTAYFPLSKTISPVAILMNSQPSTADDRIAVEFAAALRTFRSESLEFYRLANSLLYMEDSATTREAFQLLRSSPDPELKLVGLARSLRNKADLSALAELANNVDLTDRLKATSFVIPGILSRLDSDPIAIGYLGKIATSSNAYLQRAAANSLMYIHTRDTLPFLASLLDSSDPLTREYAMRGFSRFVANMPIATPANVVSGKASMLQDPTPYRTPETDRYSLATRPLAQAPEGEAAFLQFWRIWWANMKNKVMN